MKLLNREIRESNFIKKVLETNEQYAKKRTVYINKTNLAFEGLYQGKKICFAVKVAKGQFDLNEISDEQLDFFEKTELRGGYCFLLIEFFETKTVYFVPFSIFRHYAYHSKYGGRRYIPEIDLNYYAYGVKRTYRATLDYLTWVDKLIGFKQQIRSVK